MTHMRVNIQKLVSKIEMTTVMSQIGFASILCLVFVLYAYHRVLPNMFFGEEFFIFHYADTHNHLEAWQRYFLENGRFLEGVYWTYLYKLVGFKPAFIRSISMVLHLLAAIFAASAFMRVWEANRPKLLPFFLTIFLFFNPISFDFVYRISFDNNRIALILFWLAVLSLQNWASTAFSVRWYLASIVLYLLAITTYENVILLFPAGILLSLPIYLRKSNKSLNRLIFFKVMLATIFGSLLLVIPIMINSSIEVLTGIPVQSPAARVLDNPPTEIAFAFISNMLELLIGFGHIASNNNLILIFSYVFIMIAILLIYRQRNNKRDRILSKQEAIFENPLSYIFVASLWITLVGFAPFAIAGYSPTPRVYSATVFGVIPLIFLGVRTWKKIPAILVIASLIAISTQSIGDLWKASKALTITGNEYVQTYLEIKDLIPSVKDRTNFILVDFTLNGASCGNALNMLYRNKEMNCITVSSKNGLYRAIRHFRKIEGEYGGWSRYENDIILGYNENGELIIVPEITPNDNLLITWESSENIETVFDRIDPNEIETQFNLHLISSREFMMLTSP